MSCTSYIEGGGGGIFKCFQALSLKLPMFVAYTHVPSVTIHGTTLHSSCDLLLLILEVARVVSEAHWLYLV